MPKSRKKKVKHQDFAKVKLKVGKKLPRADNETNASFKSRSILLKEQFKAGTSDGSGKSGKKKLNLNEVLSQCQHYSLGNKQEALVNLRDLLIASPDIIQPNLALILERCSELFVDKETQIRTGVVKVLKVVFPHVQSANIAPFFSILSAHLCCAMTHIYEDIQMHSLIILDIVLEHFPELVVSSSSQILPNLLEQISRQASKKDSRSLVVNPSGKKGSSKWRVGVLKRLAKVLEAVIRVKKRGVIGNSDQMVADVRWGEEKSNMQLFRYPAWTGPGFILSDDATKNDGSAAMLSDGQSFKSYIQMLIPILIQCWVEIAQSQSNLYSTGHLGNALSVDALSILDSVLHVLDLLLEYTTTHLANDEHINIAWIREKYANDFNRHIMEYFPFSIDECEEFNGKKSSYKDRSNMLLALNLSACRVMSHLFDSADIHNYGTGDVVSFMRDMVHYMPSSDDLAHTLSVFGKVLEMPFSLEKKTELLKSLFGVYRKKHCNSADMRIIIAFLGRIYMDHRYEELKSLSSFRKWAQKLPKVILETENEATITLILTIMKSAFNKKDETFVQSFMDSYEKLMDRAVIQKMTERQQHLLVELVHPVTFSNSQHLEPIVSMSLDGTLKESVQRYLINILSMKYDQVDMNIEQLGGYISFLFTLLLGKNKESLPMMKSAHSIKEQWSNISINDCVFSDEDWMTHCNRVQCVLEVLKQMTQLSDIKGQVWVNFVTSQLEMEDSNLDIATSLSLLEATSQLLPIITRSIDTYSNFVIQVILAVIPICKGQFTTGEESKLSKMSENQKVELLESCVRCLSQTEGMFGEILRVAMEMSEKCSQSTMIGLLTTMKHMCLSEKLKSQVFTHQSSIRQFLQSVLKCHPQLADDDCYAAIVYHIKNV